MKLRFFAIALSAGFLSSCDDEVLPEKVPLEVRQNLLSTFPLAYNIEWEKSGKDYEADFTVHAAEHCALFRHSGELMQYKRALPSSELPEAVSSSISRSYPGYRIKEAEFATKNNISFYQVLFINKAAEVEMVFSADGQQLSQAYWD